MDLTRFARRGRRCWGLPVALLFTAFLGGCGGGPQPVEGLVVWKDGSPAKELEGAVVQFEMPEKKISATGAVQADGSFRLTTDKPNDGAPAGDYKVLIVERRKGLGGSDPSAMAPGLMDVRFSDPAKPVLEATVKPGTNKITLKVERASRR